MLTKQLTNDAAALHQAILRHGGEVSPFFCGKESKKNIEIPRSPYTLTHVRKPWLAERSLSGWPAGNRR